jgi:hypothetical protein
MPSDQPSLQSQTRLHPSRKPWARRPKEKKESKKQEKKPSGPVDIRQQGNLF